LSPIASRDALRRFFVSFVLGRGSFGKYDAGRRAYFTESAEFDEGFGGQSD
jgi:hypothetical protein